MLIVPSSRDVLSTRTLRDTVLPHRSGDVFKPYHDGRRGCQAVDGSAIRRLNAPSVTTTMPPAGGGAT